MALCATLANICMSGQLSKKNIAFLHTHVTYNIVDNDVKVMSKTFQGREVKGQGHRYIRNMKMYNIMSWQFPPKVLTFCIHIYIQIL